MRSLLGVLLLFALPAPPPKAAPEAVFVERAKELGVDFVHVNGMSGRLYTPEVMGSGVALFDYDNDGDLDVFFVQGGPLGPQAGPQAAKPAAVLNHRLYRNDLVVGPRGERTLHFTDVTAESGLRLARSTSRT